MSSPPPPSPPPRQHVHPRHFRDVWCLISPPKNEDRHFKDPWDLGLTTTKKAQIMKVYTFSPNATTAQMYLPLLLVCFLHSPHPLLKFSFCIKRPSDKCLTLCWKEVRTSALRWSETVFFQWLSVFAILGTVTMGSIEVRVDHCSSWKIA